MIKKIRKYFREKTLQKRRNGFWLKVADDIDSKGEYNYKVKIKPQQSRDFMIYFQNTGNRVEMNTPFGVFPIEWVKN